MADESYVSRLPTHERRLDNGLTVLLREDRSAPVVAIVTHVKAGYFDEPDTLVGISHVLEHMYFKGTPRRGVGEIARATKAAGGYLNAGTIYDHTSYYTVLPSSSLDLGLDVQSDALRNSLIDEEELRRELLVIIQEAKRKLDNPSAVAIESLYEAMFDVHRIRRWRIGTEEGLSRLTREDIWRYYRNLYRPSNIVLVVAGDIDPDETFARVERYYGAMPAGEPVREPRPAEPERSGFRFREMAGDIAQTYMEWGWPTPGSLHADTPVLDLLATVLGQGRASRLYRSVREPGWVHSVGSYNYTPSEIGVFGVSAELDRADAREAARGIRSEIDRVRRGGIEPAELERARNVLEARLARRLETAEGQANLLAEWQALGGWRLGDEYYDRLFSATADDVRRVAESYLRPDRATLLVYRPEREESIGWGAAEADRILAHGPATADSVPAPSTNGAAPATVAHGGTTARLRETVAGLHLYDLPGGLRLGVLPRRTAPLVSMRIACPGGAIDERVGQAGLTGLMMRVSVKATEGRSGARLAEETEALGGAIAPVATSDLFHWTLTIPSRHFDRGFGLLADAALRPTFPEAELERERKVALSDLEQLRDDMYRYPMRLFLQSAFEGHPYGFALADKEAALRTLGTDDLARWHREQVLEARPWVLVVGDVEPDRVADRVAAELEGVGGNGGHPSALPPEWPDGVREAAEQREKAQTALVIGFPGPGRDDPDRYAMQVLSNLLSGLGGRLFEELRSRRSLAYTVSAYPVIRQQVGTFISYIATSPEREAEARAGLLDELEQVAEKGVGEDEVERSRRYTIGAWQIRSQTNGARLGDLTSALLLGGGMDELLEFEDRIRSVTAEEVRDVLRRYFDRSRLVEGIVRGTGGGR